VADASTLRALVAIELDEESHISPQRQQRDDEVQWATDAAGLPFIRVLTSRMYDTRQLNTAIAPHLPRSDSGKR
jgi:hypothetical protein